MGGWDLSAGGLYCRVICAALLGTPDSVKIDPFLGLIGLLRKELSFM